MVRVHAGPQIGVDFLEAERRLGRALIINGGVAQLARAPALHAGGHRFESVHLHQEMEKVRRSLPAGAERRKEALSFIKRGRERRIKRRREQLSPIKKA